MSILVSPSNESLGQTRFFYICVFIMFCLIITTLNCVSLAVLSKRSMRSVKSNQFVISLAVSDVIVGGLLCPMLVWSTWVPLYDNSILFALLVLPHSVLIGSSTATLAAIAYDRYLMTRPSIYHNKMTTRKVKLILLVVWGIPLLSTSFLFVNIQVFAFCVSVFGVVVATVIIVSYRMIIKRINREVNANPHQVQNTSNGVNHNVVTSNTSQGSCPVNEINSHTPTEDSGLSSDVAVVKEVRSNPNQSSVSSISHYQTVHSNLSTVSVLQQQNHQSRVLRIAKNKKLARRLFTLITAFGCCILPSILLAVSVTVIKIVRKSGITLDYAFLEEHGLFRTHLRMLSTIATILNSLINPLIYVYTYPKFRAELRKMFAWFPLIGRTNTEGNMT